MASTIDTNLSNWSTTSGSNKPAGTDTSDLDADLQTIQAVVRKYLATKGSDIASGTTVDLSTATGNYVHITGSTGPIASLGTVAAGLRYLLVFDSTPTLTHHATQLILPGGADITAAAGDRAEFVSLGSGNWRCIWYTKASGAPIGSYQPLDATLTAFAGGLTAANKIPYATALNTLGELDFKDEDDMASDSATGVPSQQSVKAYVDTKITSAIAAIPSPGFSDVYSSTAQTITSADQLVLAHGLGSHPTLIRCYAKCTTGEYGYSVGDEVEVPPYIVYWSGSQGLSVVMDATNITIRFGSATGCLAALRKDTGAGAALTNGNWKLYVKAWV